MTFSPNCSGVLTNPRFLVVHYTASGGFAGTKDWLCNKASKVSAHELIGREPGEFAQLVPYDKCAWHAGPSSWKGFYGLNRYSIGIELVSWGPLEEKGGRFYAAMSGMEVPASEAVHAPHPTGGQYEYWQSFTKCQLDKLHERVETLFHQFPSLKEVVGHYDIAPGRKKDPWPMDARAEFAGIVR